MTPHVSSIERILFSYVEMNVALHRGGNSHPIYDTYKHTYISIDRSLDLSITRSIYLSLYLSIYLSFYRSITLPMYVPSIDLIIYLSITLSLYHSIYLWLTTMVLALDFDRDSHDHHSLVQGQTRYLWHVFTTARDHDFLSCLRKYLVRACATHTHYG
jgi:hypothetical protein